MKIVKEHIWIAAFILSLGGIAGWIYLQGVKDSDREVRMFRNADERIETINHVKRSPTPVQQKERSIFDSLETVKTNKMLETLINDSRSVKKHIHHLDSINLLTSDQMYQIKKEIKDNHNN